MTNNLRQPSHQATSATNWHDDIEALSLGADFDGSLSGLCIMSLSFDFTRSGGLGQATAAAAAAAAAAASVAKSEPHAHASNNKLTSTTTASNQQELSTLNENGSMNAFKRFKSSLMLASSCANQDENANHTHDNDNRGSTSMTTSITTSATSSSTNEKRAHQVKNLPQASRAESPEEEEEIFSDQEDDDERALSICTPAGESSVSSSSSSSRRSSDIDEDDEQDDDIKSPSSLSPSSSSSRSASPHSSACHHSDTDNEQQQRQRRRRTINSQDESQDLRISTAQAPASGLRRHRLHQRRPSESPASSVHSCKRQSGSGKTTPAARTAAAAAPPLLSTSGGLAATAGSLKESSYTTSVITTTAPMHFKSIHHPHPHPPPPPPHPFSMSKQQAFPASPFSHHQFSNSSFNNHDSSFYDRYLTSHDSHQPLQTPLIGIERTQDLLALKLPPHGPDPVDTTTLDSQRFTKEWLFGGAVGTGSVAQAGSDERPTEAHASNARLSVESQPAARRRGSDDSCATTAKRKKSFQFSYKSNSSAGTQQQQQQQQQQREPIDLNVAGARNNSTRESAPSDEGEPKSNMFDESMKHFNPTGHHQHHQHHQSTQDAGTSGTAALNMSHQQAQDQHAQDSMFGLGVASMADASKQKFQYILAAPISVATKLTEDTMTYLNQGQAYEIKLENVTDVPEVKKGFMCSIINIGFHERHMQQAENELWQQWSQQHPSERIFSVDMKLSYNVFGVESDGLNKCEFLWDSSKVAGVFIRINSISTEFTPRKHGGEKGIPFKLSIETFSYNSKTHDSYFISAACCQIKVFKPKGAERKIRSDRDKIFKRPANELDKYHQSCEHTIFRDCPLSSLRPFAADGSIGYYRHSHGHFASNKQLISNTASTTGSANGSARNSPPATRRPGATSLDNDDDDDNNSPRSANDVAVATPADRKQQTIANSESDNNSAHSLVQPAAPPRVMTDYSTSRLLQPSHYDNYPTNYTHHEPAGNHSSFAVINTQQEQQHAYQQTSSATTMTTIQRNLTSSTTPFAAYSHYPHHHHHHHHHQTGSTATGTMSHLTGHAMAQPPTLVSQSYGALVPSAAYQAAAAAAAASRATPAVYRGGHQATTTTTTTTTPFLRASNLALTSTHSARTNSEHCNDTSQSGGESSVNKSGAHQMAYHEPHDLHPHQQPQPQHPHNFDNHHHHHHHQLDNQLNSSGDNSSHQPPAHCYRQQRSASTSLTTSIVGSNLPSNAHCSSYVSTLQQPTIRVTGECYTSLIENHLSTGNQHPSVATNNWTTTSSNNNNQQQQQQHTNAGCLSRGCSANSNCPSNLNHYSSSYQSNCCAGPQSVEHQQAPPTHHHHHYEQHSEQDSPHKSHTTNTNTSNDSPLSCYSRFRDAPQNALNTDNNNTMSSYSSQTHHHLNQQQQQHLHHHHHEQQQQHQHEQQHQQQQHQQQQQQHSDHEPQMDLMSRSSSSLFGAGDGAHANPSERITGDSSCSEVLAWLMSNRFGPFAKTFSNFCGSDLLRLSKSELVEICGLPDGIRLFNSLHNLPMRARNSHRRPASTFTRSSFNRFAQLKRELKFKRKLK